MSVEVLCYGEPLVGIYATEERSLSQPGMCRLTWGGDASNVALAIQKLGHHAGMATKMGTDSFAKGLLALWAQEGVDTTHIIEDPSGRTGMYLVSFHKGNHEFEYRRADSSSAKYCWDREDQIDWDGIQWLHMSGISQAISKSCLEAGFEMMGIAKQHGVKISYDLNYRSRLWPKRTAYLVYWHVIREFADLISFNESEAEILGLKGDGQEIVEQLLAYHPITVCYKRGHLGAIVGQGAKTFHTPAHKIDVKDTVGAGDAFTAGMLVGLLEKMELDAMTELAMAASALTCTQTGSTEGQPRRETVRFFLNEMID